MEIEAKIKVPELDSYRARLQSLGGTPHGQVRERNQVLDDKTSTLRAAGKLLRVRSTGGDDCVLTVKAPAQSGEFKTREEIETVVASRDNLLRQLSFLGYETAWIYEKDRDSWTYGGCEIALDTLPEIGCFIEIEGTPEAIRRVCAYLNLDPKSHIDDNYLGLWQKHLAARGEAQRDMIFP